MSRYHGARPSGKLAMARLIGGKRLGERREVAAPGP
jgi:hypothetical protein